MILISISTAIFRCLKTIKRSSSIEQKDAQKKLQIRKTSYYYYGDRNPNLFLLRKAFGIFILNLNLSDRRIYHAILVKIYVAYLIGIL